MSVMICFHFIQGIALHYRGSTFISKFRCCEFEIYLLVNISICIIVNFIKTAFLLAYKNVTHIPHAHKCDIENIPFLHCKTLYLASSVLFLRS